MEIVECVPNFSTSNPKIVESILGSVKHTKNVFLLDYTFDDYYNRLVVSFVGDKKSVAEAALKASLVAVDKIDMRKHKGQHPRMGAVDVVPFIPIKDVSMTDCVELAKQFGKAFSQRSGVPSYL